MKLQNSFSNGLLKIKNNLVSNMWCIGDGDPLGPYSIDVFLNEKFIKTFGFDVLEKSAFLTRAC